MFLWGATVAADLFDQNVYPTVTNINSNTKMFLKTKNKNI